MRNSDELMSVAVPRCRFCRRTDGALIGDPALGPARVRRGVVDRRQTYHHVPCLQSATGLSTQPFPPTGEAFEDARQRRKTAALKGRRP